MAPVADAPYHAGMKWFWLALGCLFLGGGLLALTDGKLGDAVFGVAAGAAFFVGVVRRWRRTNA
jgi:hypothetical protein